MVSNKKMVAGKRHANNLPAPAPTARTLAAGTPEQIEEQRAPKRRMKGPHMERKPRGMLRFHYERAKEMADERGWIITNEKQARNLLDKWLQKRQSDGYLQGPTPPFTPSTPVVPVPQGSLEYSEYLPDYSVPNLFPTFTQAYLPVPQVQQGMQNPADNFQGLTGQFIPPAPAPGNAPGFNGTGGYGIALVAGGLQGLTGQPLPPIPAICIAPSLDETGVTQPVPAPPVTPPESLESLSDTPEATEGLQGHATQQPQPATLASATSLTLQQEARLEAIAAPLLEEYFEVKRYYSR